MGFPLNVAELSLNSVDRSLQHEYEKFNCILCQLCLCGTVVESLSLTGDSGYECSNLLKIILFLSLNSLNSFRENSNCWIA